MTSPIRLPLRRLLSTMALAVLVAGHSGRAVAEGATGHTLGVREQWQPQTESDPRLQQEVRCEILGRAAVPGLALLAAQTGVSLAVAPEDLDSLGERKFTVIAQGCSLKAIMVQLREALQECHWDIDRSGPQPVYLLHRSGDTAEVVARLMDDEARRDEEEHRPAREARLADARAALAMSADELTDLAKTDPLLAAWLRDPKARARLELLLALPAKEMEALLATGGTYLSYQTAPPVVQQKLAAWLRAEEVEIDLSQVALHFEDDSRGVSPGLLWYDAQGGFHASGSGPALPPRQPWPSDVALYRDSLLALGMTAEAADARLAELGAAREKEDTEARDRTRAAQWREPRGTELHKVITLPYRGAVDPAEVQRFVAQETGLSVISDYFTSWGSPTVPREAQDPQLAWRLLYLLGEKWFWTYDWDKVGGCVVFHDRDWYRHVLQEIPESIVLVLREKLKQQGHLTLDDVVSAAAELERLRPLPAELRDRDAWWVDIPADLQAGLPNLRDVSLLLYASLSAEQLAMARTTGLPYAEMAPTQRALIRPYSFTQVGWHRVRIPIAAEQMATAVYRVKLPDGASGSVPIGQASLRLEYARGSNNK
jgi:hypothetical protein